MKAYEKLADLRLNRYSKFLKSYEVSDALGITQRQSYGRYENGKVEPKIEIFGKASEFYKISVNYFLENNNGYGGITFLAPYYSGFNYDEGRISFENLEVKSANINLNVNDFATKFFLFEIQEDSFLEAAFLFKIKQQYKDFIKSKKNRTGLYILNNDANFIDPTFNLSNEATTFLMEKSSQTDPVYQNEVTLYLIRLRKKNKLYLAFIERFENHHAIIPIYDLEECNLISDYPYLNRKKKLKTMSGAIELHRIIDVISLNRIEVIAKVISIWDPNNNLL